MSSLVLGQYESGACNRTYCYYATYCYSYSCSSLTCVGLKELCCTVTSPAATAAMATYCYGYCCGNSHLVVRVVWVLDLVLADNLRAVLHLDCGILALQKLVAVHLSTRRDRAKEVSTEKTDPRSAYFRLEQ